MRNLLTTAVYAAAGLAVISVMSTSVDAQSLRKVTTPAENPPVSYKGKQYVDSRGCVFIRAGFGGKVTWVPRVNRQRKVYCSQGNKPSLSGSQLATLGKAAPVVKEAPKVAVAKPKPVAKPRPVRTVKVAPKPVKKVAAVAPKRVVRRAAPVVVTAPPKKVVVATPPAQTRRVVRVNTGAGQVHPGDLVRASRDGSQQAVRRVTRVQPQTTVVVPVQQTTVRRVKTAAPQTQRVANGRKAVGQVHPGDLVRARRLSAAKAANATAYSSDIRYVTEGETKDPVHKHTSVGVRIAPDVTAYGDAQMEMVWTNTVPRRLVKRKMRVREVYAANTQTVQVSKSTKSYKAGVKNNRKLR